eukprot:scaffold649_cov88-Isochrysis_galbana.AAC.3
MGCSRWGVQGGRVSCRAREHGGRGAATDGRVCGAWVGKCARGRGVGVGQTLPGPCLRDDPVHHPSRIGGRPARRRQRVDFVKEEHAGGRACRAGEELAHVPLALSHIGRDELWAFDR